MRYIVALLILIASLTVVQAQELNAKLTINTQQVQSVDQQMITTLESSINSLLNENKWSGSKFSPNEKIDCTITITINEMPSPNSFNGEIQVSARRPVYNSSYITPLINFRDTQLEFSYTLGEQLEYNSQSINSELVACIAFYCNVIAGLDFASFSPNGGQRNFAQAMEVANAMQASGGKAWKPFSGGVNRYDLALALTEETSKSFQTLWYGYHREGLDMMETNANRGRMRIVETIVDLETLYAARPSSPLLVLFAEAKLSELIKICEKATAEEKRDIKKRLQRIFPARSNIINELK